MTIETLLWILGGATIPLIGWGIQLTWLIQKIREDSDTLVTMHKEPEKYGLVNNQVSKDVNDLTMSIRGDLFHQISDVVKANTRAIQSLTHYVRWMSEFNCPLSQDSGHTAHQPPPPLGPEIDPNL